MCDIEELKFLFGSYFLIKPLGGGEDGSFCKILATQDLNVIFRIHIENPGMMVAQACNPCAGKVKTGEAWSYWQVPGQ